MSFLQNLFPRRQMQFSPVEEDDDELSMAIKNDPERLDNKWDLKEPDAQQLDIFWDDALKELGSMDPEDVQDNTA